MEEARKLARKYPNIKDDFMELRKELMNDPTTGHDSLGKGCFKVRMAIGDKNAGQSSGARVIIEVKVESKNVYVLSVYDKSEKGTMSDKHLQEALNNRLKKYPDLCD